MKRLVHQKKVGEFTEAESILIDYPLSAEEELRLIPYVENLLEVGEPVPESSEELLEGLAVFERLGALVILDGRQVRFEVAVGLMDEELREEIHLDMAPCTEQDFLDEYVKRHAEKFDGEVFVVN